jgi:MFS family permease
VQAETTPASPFAYPAWRAFFVSRIASTLAFMMLVVVIAWQVYDLARATRSVSESAFILGLVGLVQFVPIFLLAPLVGNVVDAMDRRHVARAAIALEILCALGLGWMAMAGVTTLWPWFLIAFLIGVGRAFAAPALSALAPNLVPPAVLPTAIAWSSIAWQTGAVLGPVAGGLLYDVDAPLPHWVAAALLTVSLLALFRIPPVRRPEQTSRGLAAVREGLSYVRRNPVVFGAISLDLAAVVLGGATAMLPIYARDILDAGPQALGFLRAAPAVGAALVALALARRPLQRRVGRAMFWGVGIFSVMTIVFAFSTTLWLSLVALGIMGGADMVSVYVRASLIQLHTPDAMRGRVSAVSLMFISASNELGEFRSGMVAALIGPVAATAIGGALALVVTLAWARLFPALREADRFEVPDALRRPQTDPA